MLKTETGKLEKWSVRVAPDTGEKTLSGQIQ